MTQTGLETPLPTPPRSLRLWYLLTVVCLGAATLYYVVISLHWRMMVDSAVMHYVVFLMRHGRAPYTQISDNNLPGAYFTEALGMAAFGGGDLGWRLFEFVILALLLLGLVDIARRWNSFAGILAGGLFVVVHSAEGPQYAAERELVLTTLLVASYAFLFRGVASRRPTWMLLFGLATGWAASIKPTCFPLALLLLGIAAVQIGRQRRRWWLPVLAAVAGMSLVFAADLAFLLHFRALAAFGFILKHVIPAYVGLGTPLSTPHLLLMSLPRLLFPALAITLLLVWSNVQAFGQWDWQRWSLLLGAAFGLFSFVVQRKGYLHHRYTFEVFTFLLLGVELFRALGRRAGWPRLTAAFTLVYLLLLFVPRTLRLTAQSVGHSDLEDALESDLGHLGQSTDLQDRVQCFDLVYGCLDALYHLRLVENGSFTGDLLFFPHRQSEATDYYRRRFWGVIQQGAPELIVVTNQNLAELNSFGKIARWPEFAAWLQAGYTPVVERQFTYEHFGGRFLDPVLPAEQDAYRLYVRKDSPLIPTAMALAQQRAMGQR